MQSWGVGIFDSDLAQAVRKDFEAAMAAGASIYAAADRTIEAHSNDNSIIVYLAIAALQLEQNGIQPKIKKKALTIIISGDGKEPWFDGPPDTLAARERVLEELRNRLREMPT
jgi:hypothetical protein